MGIVLPTQRRGVSTSSKKHRRQIKVSSALTGPKRGRTLGRVFPGYVVICDSMDRSMITESFANLKVSDPQHISIKTHYIMLMRELEINASANKTFHIGYDELDLFMGPELRIYFITETAKRRRNLRQYVTSRPRDRILRTRTRVTKDGAGVCAKIKWAYGPIKRHGIIRKPYLTRNVRPRIHNNTGRGRGTYRCQRRRRKSKLPGKKMTSLQKKNNPQLHLRGGFCGLFSRKSKKPQRLADDETLSPVIWWLAGGRRRKEPITGSQLREWRQRSRGDWDEGMERGFLQECGYVLSDGRYGRHQRRSKNKQNDQG